MVKGCHTGLSVFFTTSVLWQIVKLGGQGRVGPRCLVTLAPCLPHLGPCAHVPSSLLR